MPTTVSTYCSRLTSRSKPNRAVTQKIRQKTPIGATFITSSMMATVT